MFPVPHLFSALQVPVPTFAPGHLISQGLPEILPHPSLDGIWDLLKWPCGPSGCFAGPDAPGEWGLPRVPAPGTSPVCVYTVFVDPVEGEGGDGCTGGVDVPELSVHSGGEMVRESPEETRRTELIGQEGV